MRLPNPKTSLFGKIFLSIILISLITVATFSMVNLTVVVGTIEDELVHYGESLAKTISQSIEASYANHEWPFLTLKKLSESEDVLFWWVVKPDGTIYLGDDADVWGKKIEEPSLETGDLVVRDSVFYKTNERMKLIVNPINIGLPGKKWFLYLGFSLKAVQRAKNEIMIANTLSIIIILFLTSVLAVFLSKTITNPISRLKDATRELARGNFAAQAKVETKDEVGGLAKAFNHMTRELRKSDRLKVEFVNVAAHELKTPLIPVIGYLSLLSENRRLPKAVRSKLKIVCRSAQREKKLVDDILNVSKLEAGAMKFEMTPMRVEELIREAVNEAAPKAWKKGIRVVVGIPDKLPAIRGDGWRLSQVLDNLLDNAIKFTEKGTVTVEAKNRDGGLVVSVKDTGIGISKENIPKLFNKFFQADTGIKRKREGTGLGLVISKGIVEAHKGRIWAESKLGRGSTFTFSLPIAK
jgi:signal transduction histidine kinase